MTLDGYTQTRLADPFEIALGPIHERGEPAHRSFAIRIDERHVNRRNMCHGGMMMTFADATLGALAADLSQGKLAVTLNMQSQFLAPAPLGRLLTVTPELTKRTQSLLFIRGDFRVDGHIAMTASSVWKLLGVRKSDN